MADKPPSNPNLSINPPPPSTSASTSNAPFTPRSSTFPDDLDSDSEDVFEPTPVHSPSGPHYDDLPPTYDEAQQQALHDARNGVPPLDPNNLEVHQLRLNDAPTYQVNAEYQVPAGAEVHAHRAAAAELEQENRKNESGTGVNVPVQQASNTEHIPVGRVQDSHATVTRSGPSPADQASALLNTALDFTKHEPDADARYAPRLTRCVAIPQEGVPRSRKGKGRQECGRRRGRSRGRGRGDRHVPGQWPDTSSENVAFDHAEEPAQFLRAYAKALHAHSIRPAEFLDFLDGLNALCAATDTTPADLVRSESESDTGVDIVQNYINATNEAFFGPRGLKVSVQSLAMLLDAVKIPEERGQRAGAVASVLDDKSNAQRRAQALHPWVEALETSVPEPSIAALMLKEMGERFRHPLAAQDSSTAEEPTHARDPEKSRLEREYAVREASEADDPPHSIPGAFPPGQDSVWPPFGGRRGRGSWGRPGRGWGPFGGPGNGPFGPPGLGPFGPPGHGPHGPSGHTHWGPPGHGPFGAPGHGPWGRGRGSRGPGANTNNNWQALGESLGKWGEDFGRRMETWGVEFGKQAQNWGEDLGKRAEAWGDEIARSASGNAGPSSTQNTQRAQENHDAAYTAEAEADVLRGQETGVHRETSGTGSFETKSQKKAGKKKLKKNKHDDDDASSISSDSSSDSDSDSESEDEEDYPDASKIFLDRVHSINTAAEASRAKGKKSASDIERERALAIEKAQKDKTALESKIETKRMKRSVFRDFRAQRREMKREHRHVRRELRKQGKGKKSGEWREKKKEYRERKKGLRG